MTLKNNVFFKTILLSTSIILLLAAAVIIRPTTAYAVGLPAPTSCDPEYMDALEARAYMEAQREIAQNKNLIFKPESVLQYTCFGEYLNHLAGAAGFFSEVGCCGSAGLGINSLDSALQNAVGSALLTYLGNNFTQFFLNGRTRLHYDSFKGVIGGTYACDMMQRVWDAAKCMNFFNEDDHDGFYDFSWYYTHDPRPRDLGVHPPGPTSAWDPDGSGAGRNSCVGPYMISRGVANIAYNDKEANYVLPAENPWSDNNAGNDFVPYIDDPVNSYFQLILPLGDVIPGGGIVTCAAPILTGVCVNRGPNSTPYPDGVCPNPGCHYQPPGGINCASTANASWCVGP